MRTEYVERVRSICCARDDQRPKARLESHCCKLCFLGDVGRKDGGEKQDIQSTVWYSGMIYAIYKLITAPCVIQRIH